MIAWLTWTLMSEKRLLTHWGRVTHVCVSKLIIIGSDNGLLPGRHKAIIWTNAGILLIGPIGRNFNEILIKIHIFSFKKIHLKMSCQPQCVKHLRVSWITQGQSHNWPSCSDLTLKNRVKKTIINHNNTYQGMDCLYKFWETLCYWASAVLVFIK